MKEKFSIAEIDSIYDLYEDCIRYGVEFTSKNFPFGVISTSDIRGVEKEIVKDIKKNLKKGIKPIQQIPKTLRKLSVHEYDKNIEILKFEQKMENVFLSKCPSCTSTTIPTDKSTSHQKLCSTCSSDRRFKVDKKSLLTPSEQRHQFLLKNEMLPVWYKKDDLETKHNPQYHVPDELNNLTTAEILLIQRYSAFVPVYHMSQGNTGMKGHCVCFLQNTQEVCDVLPRTKCNIVKIVKSVEETGISLTKNITVNKEKVLGALRWLKVHHRYYKDIVIKESNLDWMKDKEECCLSDDMTQTIIQQHNTKSRQESTTVSSTQTDTIHEDCDNITTESFANNNINPSICTADKDIFDELNEAEREKNDKYSMAKFPEISEEAICEYSEDILPNVFPHLYPGGIGGSNNNYTSTNEQSLHKYAKRLLNYEDGRFANDSIWSYYVLDMIQRSKNNNNGNYIIKDGFLGETCASLDELKEKINDGDLSWIELIRNYSKRIRGSDNYWRSKRAEVETWINYHVEHGHGAPTLFLTLSCAENWWSDLKRILKEKLKCTSKHYHLINDLDSEDERKKMSARSKASVLFSVTVQEFFQKRVNIWLETVGKKVFGIKYYWGRYEFAKGRGQIHLHLLAIVENRWFQMEYYKHVRQNNPEQAITVLANYAKQSLGLTAEHPAYDIESNILSPTKVSTI